MKFECKECKETKDIYRVSLSSVNGKLVCKDAECCNDYMETSYDRRV